MRILVIDDEPDSRVLACRFLKVLGHTGYAVKHGDRAADLLRGHKFDATITDVRIPGRKGGLAILAEIKSEFPEARVLIMTGYYTPEIEQRFLSYGAGGVIDKNRLLEGLRCLLDRLVERSCAA